MSLSAPIFLQLLIAQGIGATTFHTNCSLPTQETTFHIVTGPNIRSTWSILLSCLFTIFICTWTVQHPDVPYLENKSAGYLGRTWRKQSQKLRMMSITILAPELALGQALKDHCFARSWARCDVLRDHAARANGAEWTQTHAYLSQMNGFVLEEYNPTGLDLSMPLSISRTNPQDRARDDASRLLSERAELPGRLHAFDRPDAGFTIPKSCSAEHDEWMNSNLHPLDRDTNPRRLRFPFVLDCMHLCFLLRRGLVTRFPRFSEDEIKDKSKEDLAIKLLSLWQILWLCIELIIRKINGLASTQLEIATLSFAVCTCFTYIIWLNKPKDIGVPVALHLSRSLSDQDKSVLLHVNTLDLANDHKMLDRVHKSKLDSRLMGSHWNTMYLGYALGGMVFGACHCFAWSFDFPTHIEQTLWRIASITQLAAATPVVLLGMSLDRVNWDGWKEYGLSLNLGLLFVLCGLYVLSRVYIMVEVFRSLFFSPPGAFVATWTSSVPHVG